jgi:hypothetical protein
VLEGKLKDGLPPPLWQARHVHRRRHLARRDAGDYYDTRGQLWQHGPCMNYYYAFDMNAWQAGTSFYHDLNSGSYVAYNLFQERETSAPSSTRAMLNAGPSSRQSCPALRQAN